MPFRQSLCIAYDGMSTYADLAERAEALRRDIRDEVRLARSTPEMEQLLILAHDDAEATVAHLAVAAMRS